MTRFSTLLLIASAAVVAGCVSYDLEWTRRSGFGPTIGQGVKAPVFQKCEQKLMDGARQCALAFEDARGQKIDVFRGLVPAVDSYLQNLPEFQSWPKSNGLPVQTKIPYKLHLLTISPAIVVLVPSPPAQLAKCWVDAPEGKASVHMSRSAMDMTSRMRSSWQMALDGSHSAVLRGFSRFP